jgi:hypothetical protein
VFSSLHTAVGLAFVGAVVGEYLGSSQGVGYLILQAEGSFDINTVMAGILVLTVFALLLDALVGQAERRLIVAAEERRDREAIAPGSPGNEHRGGGTPNAPVGRGTLAQLTQDERALVARVTAYCSGR